MSAPILPFRAAIPQADLDDLKQRLLRTRWPERETVTDWNQGVPLADACGKDQAQDEVRAQRKLERLFAAASRHRKATAPLDVLAAMGGFEIGMLCGAMIQAASERRVVIVDGFVAGTAALLARALVPAVADYLVHAHRSAEPGHRLLLIHLQTQPLLDMELNAGEGMGALLAWPLLLAAQRLLER